MISVIIPIYNPDERFRELLRLLHEQSVEFEIIILDSSPHDNMGFEVRDYSRIRKIIKIVHFNHGASRNTGVEVASGAILVFLTQDVLPVNNHSIEKLINLFNDQRVGAAYGRQLPRPGAGPIEAHARLFNYPPESCIKTMSDVLRLKIKTAFMSNSFAAYRKEALLDAGGFPADVILSEDMYVGAKLLLKGWKIAYCADAMVYHSHGYNIWKEFKRYFDIGVFHHREDWILKTFGGPEGEGRRFVLSEIKYLLKEAPFLIPSAMLRNVMKFIAYNLGRRENLLPLWLKSRLSMHRNFWI